MEVYLINGLLALILTVVTMVGLFYLLKKHLGKISYINFFGFSLVCIFSIYSLYFFLCFQLTLRLWLLF